MPKPTPTPPPICCACGEPIDSNPMGSFHVACIERLLAKQRAAQRKEAGASMIEYLMLMAFVAVFAIVGLRAIGPVAADMFNTERLGLTTAATAPAEVLGVTLERPSRFVLVAHVGCQAAGPLCPASQFAL